MKNKKIIKLKNKIKNKIFNIKKNIKKYKNKILLLKEKYVRILAEFENYKNRNEKEKKNIYKIYIGKIIKDILPILDDFERYIKIENIKNNNVIYLIYKNFIKILKSNGLKKIEVNIGDKFNSDYHEAISLKNIKDKNMKNKIVKILENGYLVYDKIIRCSKVIVGNYK
ncbi:MAG: hypothetical protein RDO_0090 [Flavobacteriales endosymbiont of Rhyzopertha dominica]|nr:MAG: nucleotide exchange factor GrpE [Candidatus Shikimatogenerans bostrichidophilus]